MKKFFLFTAAILFAVLGMTAQEPQGKLNVFIDYFSRPSSVSAAWAEAIRNNVMEGIQKTNRVNLIDVDASGVLSKERDRREQDNASAGDDLDRLKVMTEEGANMLIQGVITSVTTNATKDSKGQISSYDAAMVFTLKVVDPSNGTTVMTQNYKIPKDMLDDMWGGIKNTSSTEDDAVQARARQIVGKMKGFVDEAFPTVGKIIDLDVVKNNDVKTAYINLGTSNGMAKGAKFEVRVKRMIGGKTSLKMLGEAEVVDVESDDLSKVKIKKGGKEIYEAFNAGQDLVVRSTK